MAPLALPIIMGISAAAGIGTTIASLVSQPSAPKVDTNTAEEQAKATQAAAQAQAEALTKRRGMAATQLTSPMGTTAPASTQKATLGS